MSTNNFIYLLFAFVILGLLSQRLGQRRTSYLLAGIVVAFMIYAYRKY